MASESQLPFTAVLVAGRDTRHLRVPKQNLPFGGTTVLLRTVQAYIDAGFPEVIVVLGYKADQIEPTLEPLPSHVRRVRNMLYEEGIVSFIRVGVREAMNSGRPICLGLQDQPTMTADLLRELAQGYQEGKKKILVPAYQGDIGMPAFFDPSLFEELTSIPTSETLWTVLKRHGDDLLDHPTGYSAVVRSIDDLEDYRELLRLAGLPAPDAATMSDMANPAPSHPSE